MLPKTLALIDDDLDYCEGLSRYLIERGIEVDAFTDSNALLAHSDPYRYECYVTDLMLPGVDGIDLIKILRLRTNAGVLVVSGRLASDTFRQVVTAGADMYLSKPVQFEQVELAIEAVCRRASLDASVHKEWHFDRRRSVLTAPDGALVELSSVDVVLLECFMEAKGDYVSRETLLQRLGRANEAEASGGLNAMIFRLRRRIERATPVSAPLQTKSGVGYAFKAPLTDR